MPQIARQVHGRHAAGAEFAIDAVSVGQCRCRLVERVDHRVPLVVDRQNSWRPKLLPWSTESQRDGAPAYNRLREMRGNLRLRSESHVCDLALGRKPEGE